MGGKKPKEINAKLTLGAMIWWQSIDACICIKYFPNIILVLK